MNLRRGFPPLHTGVAFYWNLERHPLDIFHAFSRIASFHKVVKTRSVAPAPHQQGFPFGLPLDKDISREGDIDAKTKTSSENMDER